MNKRRVISILLAFAAILFLSMPAAALEYGNFQITFGGPGAGPTWDPALNDGYGNEWLFYDDGPENVWWNQWWYNHPFDPTRFKVVELGFLYDFTDPDGWLDVTINWSAPGWSPNPNAPPLPGEGFVERLSDSGILWRFDPAGGESLFYLPPTRLPVPYNPEWVSVDLIGESVIITQGFLGHDCVVPVPAAVWLLGSGLVGLIGLKRRFKS